MKKNLVFVGMFENIIIHQLPLFVEEVEAKSPAFEFSADDADVVGALFAVQPIPDKSPVEERCTSTVGHCVVLL